MDRLPPIPTPPGEWWRVFCHHGLPIVIFGIGVLVAGGLWQRLGGGRSFVAVAEGARAGVLAPQPGELVEILVAPYAEVRRGDPVAVLRAFDPRGDMDRARLRLEMARLRAAPSLAEERAVDLERFRLDLARTRSELATARVRLEFATREVQRLEPLFRDRLISEDVIEIARGTRDMNAAEVREKERFTDEVEARLDTLQADRLPFDPGPGTDPLLGEGGAPGWAGVETRTLRAPVDGTVGPWLHRPGEFVVEGEPLVVIQGSRAERIVGYLRQPIGFDPRAGMTVQVARRTLPRTRFPSVIRHVGTQFETITNALALVRDGVLWDVGLPVIVEVGPDHPLRPGEIVDVVVAMPAATTPPLAALSATLPPP